ncbi:MAG TPA: ABC transporter permease [Thermomicrobiales bacterium]|nr:ABC transporter permease [Thermomicrobiales bacterium]HRA47400.1 ABC transporter permease [Thermomicrobiales bacterium]
MFNYIIRRLFWVIPVVVIVSAVTFFMMSVAPGGPWDREKPLPPAAVANLNAQFGLDKPKWINTGGMSDAWNDGTRNPITLFSKVTDSQFLNYLQGVVTGDLGPTYESKGSERVQDVIRDQFPVSLRIGMVGVLFALFVGIPLGVISSLRQNTWLDYTSLLISTIGISVPTFVSGLLLLIFMSRNFGVSPIKRPEAWQGLFSTAYILPGIVLGLGTMAYITRLTRSTMLEVMRNDYVRTARAKGLSEKVVVPRHMLRNALIPVVTIIGPAAADLVTGSIIIETIFNAPGLGKEFVNSIGKRDYSMIVGITIFYAVLIAMANVLVDLSYGFIDPRIRRR